MADMTPCVTCGHAVDFHEADGCHVYVDGGGGKLNAVCSCSIPIVLVEPSGPPEPRLEYPPGVTPLLIDFENPPLARNSLIGLCDPEYTADELVNLDSIVETYEHSEWHPVQ